MMEGWIQQTMLDKREIREKKRTRIAVTAVSVLSC